jgi:DNA-directed RNA polymerase specialized sigma24 family protein
MLRLSVLMGKMQTELLRRVLAAEAAAWHELWRVAEPVIWNVTGRWQALGPLSKSAEDRRDVVLRVMEKLREGDFRRLRAFSESAGAGSEAALRAWIAVVATRVAIDHVRAHPEHVDPRGRRGDERWARLVPLDQAPELADERNLDGSATALRLLERARQELSVEQLSALYLWLDGVELAAIARRIGAPDDRAALRVVRAALKRLRDRFREAPSALQTEDRR